MMTYAFNLLDAVVAALAASPVLAARQDPRPVALTGEFTSVSFDETHAVPDAREQDRAAPLQNLQPTLSDLLSRGSEDWQAYQGLPVVGIVEDTDGKQVLTVPSYYSTDKRDDYSRFAVMHTAQHAAAVLLHHPAVEGEPAGGVLLEVVENGSSGGDLTDGWFLAVHDQYPSDTQFGEGTVRLMAHMDVNKAAIWKFEEMESKTVLKLIDSRAATSGPALGGYLMIPDGAYRDDGSKFLAVGQISGEDGLGVSVSPA